MPTKKGKTSGKRSMPGTLKKFQALRKKKTSVCAGRAKKSDLTKAANAYIAAAVKGGQTKTEARAKANRVINGKCSVSARPKRTTKSRARA